MKSAVIASLLVLCLLGGAFAQNAEDSYDMSGEDFQAGQGSRTPSFRPVKPAQQPKHAQQSKPAQHKQPAQHKEGSYTPQWSDCGDANSNWVTTSVTLDNKPAKGQTLSGTTCGTVKNTSTFANDFVTVKVNGKTDLSQTVSLGNKQVQTGGTFCYSANSKIPSIAPSGNYQITSVLKDPSGNVLGCTNIYFTL